MEIGPVPNYCSWMQNPKAFSGEMITSYLLLGFYLLVQCEHILERAYNDRRPSDLFASFPWLQKLYTGICSDPYAKLGNFMKASRISSLLSKERGLILNFQATKRVMSLQSERLKNGADSKKAVCVWPSPLLSPCKTSLMTPATPLVPELGTAQLHSARAGTG